MITYYQSIVDGSLFTIETFGYNADQYIYYKHSGHVFCCDLDEGGQRYHLPDRDTYHSVSPDGWRHPSGPWDKKAWDFLHGITTPDTCLHSKSLDELVDLSYIDKFLSTTNEAQS